MYAPYAGFGAKLPYTMPKWDSESLGFLSGWRNSYQKNFSRFSANAMPMDRAANFAC
jgi:hypothetical protein